MHHFSYKKAEGKARTSKELYCEDIAVSDLAKQAGTPLFVYSQRTILDNVQSLEQAFGELDVQICYAVKANSAMGILHLLGRMDVGFDIVSIGELLKVRQAVGEEKAKEVSGRCVFAGVGKTEEEIVQALKWGIYSFNVESIPELERINAIAKKLHKKAPVSLRVNPNVDAGTHAKITTGTYENKFGIAFEEIEAVYKKISVSYKNLTIRGVQMHIGSQLTTVDPYVKAVKKMLPLVTKLRDLYGIEFFSLGGGIGIAYDDALASGSPEWAEESDFITPAKIAQELIPLLSPLGVKVLLEPGRFIVGNAGILVTRVEYVKQTGKKNFVIVDAAMNDLIRPAMYDAHHQIITTSVKSGTGTTIMTDVVGPICESGDTFAHDITLPSVKQGDYLAIMSAGAYGMSMASHYNARPLAAEIIVSGEQADYLRIREQIQNTWRYEGIPLWLTE